MRFQPDLVTVVDDLRLDILLRMLKSPHFSAKMNSLKEVSLLCYIFKIKHLWITSGYVHCPLVPQRN